jgi:hypothetical protein
MWIGTSFRITNSTTNLDIQGDLNAIQKKIASMGMKSDSVWNHPHRRVLMSHLQVGIRSTVRSFPEIDPMTIIHAKNQVSRVAGGAFSSQLDDILDHANPMMTLSVLSLAAAAGERPVVSYILNKSNVDTDATDTLGMTPLLWACTSGNSEVVNLLLSAGWSIAATNGFYWNALDLAYRNKRDFLVTELNRSGVVPVGRSLVEKMKSEGIVFKESLIS